MVKYDSTKTRYVKLKDLTESELIEQYFNKKKYIVQAFALLNF